MVSRPGDPTDPERIAAEVRRVHAVVDEEVRNIAAWHGPRLKCRRGCSGCCQDGITVFQVEATLIRLRHADLLRDEEPAPAPGCAFLDAQGACRIYEDRPYVCRTQGLPLRWIDDLREVGRVELRDICELNEEGPPIEELPAGSCWTLGPVEQKLANLQEEVTPGRKPRVPLRDLFRKPPDQGAAPF